MIRVMIVEDEPPILRRIKNMIERYDPVFEIAFTATDGAMALEYMVQDPCDLVITDIRMPVMDGLQLMNEIRIRYPECIVVVLSGYKEFDYAAHAIRNQAIDYLLKPVSEEDMIKLLDKVKALYMRFNWEKKINTLAGQLNRSIIKKALNSANNKDSLGVFLLNLGSVLAIATYFLSDSYWKHVDLTAIYEQVESFMESNCTFFIEFAGDTPNERIFVYQSNKEGPSVLANSVYKHIKSISSIPVFIACLTEEIEMSEVRNSVTKLRNCLLYKARIGQSLFWSVGKNALINVDSEKEYNDAETVQKIYELFKAGRFRQSTSAHRELLQRFIKENWTHFRIYELFSEVITLFKIEPEKKFIRPLSQFERDVISAVCFATSLEDLEDRLCSIDELVINPAEEIQKNPGSKIAHNVKRYLEECFTQQGLTTQVLAEEFGYVPGYISQLFKQNFGMSPMNYLTRLRVEKAKELMKENPDILISEVAESVGFINQHHFSRIFKKYEGMWPSSFKSLGL
ncbi:MAG TPA: response regulator [Clostridiaceae bacterium]|nr:response regulator [Clostridiaceae bacterium]